MLNEFVDRALTCFNKIAPTDKTASETIVIKQQQKHRERGDGMSSCDRSRQNSLFADQQKNVIPDADQLEEAFHGFVAELDLSPEKEAVLYDQPIEKKWLMLVEQGLRQDKMAIYQSCEFFVNMLRTIEEQQLAAIDNDDHHQPDASCWRHLDTLVVTLRTQSHSYIQRFLKLGGLDALTNVLELCLRRAIVDSTSLTLLFCFRALLNSTDGRNAVLESNKCLSIIASTICLMEPKCKIVSLEILSGLCLLSDGHRRVLKALASASELIGERTRFQRLIDDLWRPYRTSREEIRVKTAIMSLVNALMKTGAAENSLEFRLHLRYEMLMLGMQEVVDRLRRVDAPILHDHLDLFEMMRQEDEQELASSVDSGASSPVDYENPSAIADMIAHRLGDSVALPHFIALMQHLLMVPGDEKHVHLWRLFDMVLQQLSLQATMGGMIADCYEPVINVDMDVILSRLHTQHEYEKLERSHTLLSTELQNERTRMLEMQNRLADLHDNNPSLTAVGTAVVGINRDLFATTRSSSDTSLPPVGAPSTVPPPPPPPSSDVLRGIKSKYESLSSSATIVTPNKRVPKPSVPLKTLNWTKLSRDAIVGSIWENSDDEKLYKQFDLNDIVTQFAAKTNASGDSIEASEMMSTLQRRLNGNNNHETISVLESRRAQNCTILLSKLKLTNREICQALLSMDAKNRLPRDMVEQLLKFIPTKEEIALLNEAVLKFKSASCLAIADRFLLEMSLIPRYEERLRCLHIIRTFRERIDDVKPAILAITRAAQVVTSNKRLRQLLSMKLSQLWQTKRRCSRYHTVIQFNSYSSSGFTLASLNNINDVKNSLRTDRTLLHYLLEMIENKFSDLLRLKRELACVYEAARYSCQDINQELRSLQTALNVVDDELKLQKQRLHRQQSNNNISDENDNHVVDGDASTPAIINDTMIDQQQNIAGDRFVSVVDAFLCAARNDFADLNSLFADMKRSFSTCVKNFGGDENRSVPDEFFGELAKFLTHFEEAHHSIWQEREDIERVKRQTIVRSIFAKKSKRKDIGARGDFEHLVSALQSGELFSDELSRLRTSFRGGRKQNINKNNASSPTKHATSTAAHHRDR